MPIPAGYTQLTTGFWRKDSDLSGPYAWTGAAFYLISTGVAGSGVPADYTQHPSGFWFKTADASGPYSYDGTNFWLAGNGGPSGAITVATVNVSSAINMANGSTFNLYNTADQTTNYERLRMDWSSNVAQVWTGISGTGIARTLRIGSGTSSGGTAPTRFMEIGGSGVIFTSTTSAASGASVTISSVGQLTASSGTQYGLTIGSTINQSGTAVATILNVDPIVTATGSGTYLAQRWGWNGTELARINSNGTLTSTDISTANQVTFRGGSISATQDVILTRDAANTLAQRNSTNAQTFRIYNTYTDASNYERLVIGPNGSDFAIFTQSAGTGSSRALYFGTAGTQRFLINQSGHLLAVTDNTYDIGVSGATRPRTGYFGTSVVTPYLAITDGIAAPGAGTGVARLYVDTADGDLKVVFADGTIKTIVTDT